MTDEMWRALGAGIPDILMKLDVDGTILYMNRSSGDLSPDEVIGSSVFRYAPAASQGRLQMALRDVVERGEIRSIELPITLRDGRVRWFQASAGPLRDGTRVLSATVIARDVSAWKTAEFALRQLERQIQQFQKLDSLGQIAGGIAHDFNNLLVVIQSSVDMLLPALPAGSDEHEDALAIRTAAERGSQLTRQILAFARNSEPRREFVDVNATVEHVSQMLERVIGPHIVIQPHLHAGGVAVLAERAQLDQVLANLLLNARDAMPGGGSIAVTTRLDSGGEEVVLRVSDTGVGMDDATVGRIFEPFFTTKPPGRGTGLGLSTVSMIVKQLGGRITVQSRKGVGTTFELTFPRSRPECPGS